MLILRSRRALDAGAAPVTATIALTVGLTSHSALAQSDAAQGDFVNSISGQAVIVTAIAVALVAIFALIVQRRAWSHQRGELARLHEESQRYAAFLASSPQPFWGTSDQERVFYSRDCARFLGVARCETFDQIAEALDSEDAATLQDAFADLRRSGRTFQIVLSDRSARRRIQVSGRSGPGARGGGLCHVLWLGDVTAREREVSRLADQLQLTEKIGTVMRGLLDALPVPVWLRSQDLRLEWVNQAYAGTMDLPSSEVVAQGNELAAGVIAEGGRALASRAAQWERPQTEIHHVVVRGERRLLAITEAPFSNFGGIVGYALDRTEVEDAQVSMSRQSAAHAEVLEQLKSAIAIYGADKRLSFYNQAYVSFWGFDERWLESRPTLSEALEDLRERRRLEEYADFPAFKQAQMALFHKLIEPHEDLVHLPDGTTLRAFVAPHPLGGLLFVQEDVTSSLTLEEQFNTLIAVQRETLDNLSEGIAVFGGDGRLQLSNPSYAKIWGLREDDLSGRPHVTELLSKTKHFFPGEEDWSALRSDLVEGAMDREGSKGRIPRIDDTTLDYLAVPLPDGGSMYSFLDVTDSIKVEQALRASNEALETADRLKSEFIANVSYQLRTPLNAIMGFAEILDNEYFGKLNERQAEYIRNVIEASHRLLTLINDILDLATIEAGYMALDLREVDIHAMVNSVYNFTREWAGKQDIRVAIDCAPQIGVMEADERRLKQALFNLVSNAIKFTPPGGRITLSAERNDDQIRLAVVDTGIGIPEADHERVFGRFERANPQLRMSGVGLGLALVKSFIEMHGGEVLLTSLPGEGTTVACALPATRPADERRPASLAGNEQSVP